jgi:hypothetical protein
MALDPRRHALGESFDPDKLERLAPYEVHFDRKLERTLRMILRLKDLRQGAIMCDFITAWPGHRRPSGLRMQD